MRERALLDARAKPGAWARVAWAHPLCRLLLGCWLMNEGGGAAIYDQASRQALTLGSGDSWIAARMGVALSCSGTSSQMQYAANTSFLDFGAGATFSAECWFQTTATAATAMGLLSKQQGSGSGILWKLDVTSGHKLSAQVNGKSATCATTCNDGAWHQGALVYDQATVYLYQDGLLCASVAAAGLNASNAAYFAIAEGYNGGGQLFTGQIGLARVWGRALAAAEIEWLYREPYAMVQRLLPARYWSAATGSTARPVLNYVSATAGGGCSRSGAADGVSRAGAGDAVSRSGGRG